MPRIEIYLSDLTEEKQKEVLDIFGDNGNSDTVPFFTLDFADVDTEESQVELEKNTVEFYDELTGTYFFSTIEKVRNEIHSLSYWIKNEGMASLNDYCAYLQISRIKFGEFVGWRSHEWSKPEIRIHDIGQDRVTGQDRVSFLIHQNCKPTVL